MPDVTAVLVPQMNVNDDNAVIVAWQIPSGTHVESGRAIATLETTKATFDVNAERAGYVFYAHEAKSVVPVGSLLAWLSDDPSAQPPTLGQPESPESQSAATEGRITRKALRRMRELGIAPGTLPASGRVKLADVEQMATSARAPHGAIPPQVATQAAPAAPLVVQPDGPFQPLEQSASKVMEAVRLAENYRQIVPSMVTLPLSVARVAAKLAALAPDAGSVSLLELAIREVAGLLADYPDLNGFYMNGRAYTYRDIAVGFAVNAGNKSLKVPVVRAAGDLTQRDVCRSVRELTLKYFRDELSMADVSGGTFTITDLSGIGVTHFTPVLNDRQAAILGLCAPGADSASQNMVLAFDHRMSDGMRAGTFLGELRERVEG